MKWPQISREHGLENVHLAECVKVSGCLGTFRSSKEVTCLFFSCLSPSGHFWIVVTSEADDSSQITTNKEMGTSVLQLPGARLCLQLNCEQENAFSPDIRSLLKEKQAEGSLILGRYNTNQTFTHYNFKLSNLHCPSLWFLITAIADISCKYWIFSDNSFNRHASPLCMDYYLSEFECVHPSYD